MKNKSVAAMLAFFLGGLGAHKFYLGENGTGVLYLIFFWTYIPGILAFFEFIGLLVMSEDVFNAQYNPGAIQTGRFSGYLESSLDKVNTLKELKNLYDSGVITAEEFEAKRRKILDSL